MISVEDAIIHVLKQTTALPVETLPLSASLANRVLAEDVYAKENFPPFPASIMDGYAVKAPLQPGTYPLARLSKLAGSDTVTTSSVPGSAHPTDVTLSPADLSPSTSDVVYITTGAAVPEGFNAVIMVEDTERFVDPATQQEFVKILSPVAMHENIRQVGSDIQADQLLLRKLSALSAADLGLLATAGVQDVPVYRRPVVGVLSTGDEVVPHTQKPEPGQIRDSNRIVLISLFQSLGVTVQDLGISSDDYALTKKKIQEAAESCDVIVSTGGVSMGAADFVKPIIKELGEVFFDRLNLKPGKPTTFGVITSGDRRVLCFGLPGNPVSSFVTKILFIDPAIKRLQGQTSSACLPPQIPVKYVGKPLKRDRVRVEYQRVSITRPASGPYAGQLIAESTGFQRSSRLLSVREAQGLIRITPGETHVPEGEVLEAIIFDDFSAPHSSLSLFPKAALLDDGEAERERVREKEREEKRSKGDGEDYVGCTCCSGSAIRGFYASLEKGTVAGVPEVAVPASVPSIPTAPTHVLPPPPSASAPAPVALIADPLIAFTPDVLASKNISSPSDWRIIRTGLLTISDRASQGVYQDLSGPEMEKQLLALAALENYPVLFHIVERKVVSDDPKDIQKVIESWTNPLRSEFGKPGVDFILTSGGTGFGLRDTTPETIKGMLHRESPGISQALLNEGLKFTPLALLSRPVSGTRHATFIATLPGSVKAIRENISALKPLIPRIVELLKTNECGK